MKKIILVMTAMACFGVASEIKSVYTDKEVHDMATAYKAVMNRTDDFSASDNVILILGSSEFRGYVGGMLDTQEMFKECAQTHTLQDITHKTALVVDSLDANESAPSAVTMFVSVKMACDDENWKHK